MPTSARLSASASSRNSCSIMACAMLSISSSLNNPSGGKSSLVRAIVKDLFLHSFFKKEKNLGLWLSEETVEDYQSELSKTITNFGDSSLFLESDLVQDLHLFR